MTNITDEGLMFEAQKLTGSDCVCEDLKLLTPNDPICHLHKTFSVLKQVRDAAKKEEREACIKSCKVVADNAKKDHEQYGHDNDAAYYGMMLGADDCITAIRQME